MSRLADGNYSAKGDDFERVEVLIDFEMFPIVKSFAGTWAVGSSEPNNTVFQMCGKGKR